MFLLCVNGLAQALDLFSSIITPVVFSPFATIFLELTLLFDLLNYMKQNLLHLHRVPMLAPLEYYAG
jgi:hypothetical protein